MSSVTYTVAEQKVIKAEILASLKRQSAELAAQIEKKEAELEALDSITNHLLQEAEDEAKIEAYTQAAHDAFQAAEASAELRRRETQVCCDKCEEYYERNGRAHDEFRYDKDGEYGICGDCYDGEYDEDSESEEEDEEEYEEGDRIKCVECEQYYLPHHPWIFGYDKNGKNGTCCYCGGGDDEEEYVDSGAFDEMIAMLNINEPKPEVTDLFAELVAQANAE